MVRPSLLEVVSLTIAIRSASADLDYTKAPPNLTEIEDTSLYWTWRAKAHILPLSGTLQDPCMHYTDLATGFFHVNYLLNKAPNGASGTKTNDLVSDHKTCLFPSICVKSRECFTLCTKQQGGDISHICPHHIATCLAIY